MRDDVLQSWSAETSRDADARVEMRVAASVRRAIQQAIAARRGAVRAKREAAAARRETRLADADEAAAQTRVEELHAQLLAANRAATTMRTEGERARASLVEVVAAERSASIYHCVESIALKLTATTYALSIESAPLGSQRDHTTPGLRLRGPGG